MKKEEEKKEIELGASIILKELNSDEKVVIDNASWELIESLSDSKIRNKFFEYKYYMNRCYEKVYILEGKMFMITKMTKKQINLIYLDD